MTEIEEWLKNYQEDLVTAPICNKELILQWIDFYKASKLPEEIKTPLLQMLQEGTFMGAPVSDRVIIAQEIIPTIKKLIEMGLWDNVVKLLFISCSVCNGISEREKRQKNKAQTENACKEKRVRLIKRIVPLEGFLREVEFHWHPNGDTTNERFSNHSRQMALKKIFNLHEAEIMQEFEKQRIKKNSREKYLKYFENLFVEYTEAYRKGNNERTVSGFKIKPRKRRSEESRKRSSIAAKKMKKK